MFKCSASINISSITFIPPKEFNPDLPLQIYAKKRKDNFIIKKKLNLPKGDYHITVPFKETLTFRSTLKLQALENNKPKFNMKLITITMSQYNSSKNHEKIFFRMYLPLHKILNKQINLTKLLGIGMFSANLETIDKKPVGNFVFRIEYSLKEVGIGKLFRKQSFLSNNAYDSDSDSGDTWNDDFDLQTYDFSMASDQKEDAPFHPITTYTNPIEETKGQDYVPPPEPEPEPEPEPVPEPIIEIAPDMYQYEPEPDFFIINEDPEPVPYFEPEPEPEPYIEPEPEPEPYIEPEPIVEPIIMPEPEPEPEPEPIFLPPPPPPSILLKELSKYTFNEMPPPLVRPFCLSHPNYKFDPSVYVHIGSLNTTLRSKQRI